MEKIGRHVYSALKGRNDLTPEQFEQVEDYEKRTGRINHDPEASRAYLERINELARQIEQEETKIESRAVYERFLFTWEKQVKTPWIKNDITLQNLAPILFWFCRDDRFFDCKNISKLSEPSFEKGLMLIGGYGIGKSETMKVMQLIFSTDHFRSFKFNSANEIIHRFESCQEAHEKEAFWKYVMNGRACFDDIKNEREASNYGKVSIFKEILIERANRKQLTHMTTNYKSGSVEATIQEFGEKYDSVLYDRLFSSFNFIEFEGKSFRK